MFDETLLDSSPSRVPVLRAVHYLISIGLGVLGFLAWYFGAPFIFAAPESTTAAIVQSVLYGAVPFLMYGLILSYVYSDSKHLGFNTWVWFVICFVLNIVGLLFYLIYSATKTGDWKRATIPIAYIFEILLVGVGILVPLIYTEALPKAMISVSLVAPPPPPPPPPPPAAAPPPVRVIRRVTAEELMRAPTVIPKTIAVVKDQPVPQGSVGVVGGVPGGLPGGAPGGVLGSILSAAAPPPPPKPEAPKRIRVGGQVEAAKAIYRPSPEYTPLAKMARIQGVVRLEAVISRDGTIQDLKMLSGHPLLVKAAMEAVQKWRYQPTLLNGEPVEVVTEIDVNFTLQD